MNDFDAWLIKWVPAIAIGFAVVNGLLWIAWAISVEFAIWKTKRRRTADRKPVVIEPLDTKSDLLQQQMNQVVQQNALTTQMLTNQILNP